MGEVNVKESDAFGAGAACAVVASIIIFGIFFVLMSISYNGEIAKLKKTALDYGYAVYMPSAQDGSPVFMWKTPPDRPIKAEREPDARG